MTGVDPTVDGDKGEPDVACQVAMLSTKTKFSMVKPFLYFIVTLRVYLLSYVGYYLFFFSRGGWGGWALLSGGDS